MLRGCVNGLPLLLLFAAVEIFFLFIFLSFLNAQSTTQLKAYPIIERCGPPIQIKYQHKHSYDMFLRLFIELCTFQCNQHCEGHLKLARIPVPGDSSSSVRDLYAFCLDTHLEATYVPTASPQAKRGGRTTTQSPRAHAPSQVHVGRCFHRRTGLPDAENGRERA